MRLIVVSLHVPDPEGSAAGRSLHALVEGMRVDGHDVAVVSWGAPPRRPLPEWCEWRACPAQARWRVRTRSLLRPRWDAAALRLPFDDDVVAVADDPPSYAAVAGARRHAVTVHYATAIDARVVRESLPRAVQDLRGERHAVRSAGITIAMSSRVGDRLSARRLAVAPMALAAPADPIPLVENPVAALVADWSWAPNAVALRSLLRAWPDVRARVPAARLLLAGRGMPSVAAVDGVESVGPVDRSTDILARAAVLAFPCPPTSGPKTKILEAVLLGLPVVTTAAGVEGIDVPSATVAVADERTFAAELAAVLTDPARRAVMARDARASALATHTSVPAARARIGALAPLTAG